MSWLREVKEGVIIDILTQPQSKKNELVGFQEERLKVKIKSPPVDGKANECLCEYLAEIFNLRQSQVEIIKGLTSKKKQIFIARVESIRIQEMVFKLLNE